MKTVLVLISLTFSRLANEMHIEFFKIVDSILTAAVVARLKLTDLYALFRQAFDKESASLDAIFSSELSPKISESDVKMDRGWSGLNGWERMMIKKIRIHLCYPCHPCSIPQKSKILRL